MKSTKLKWLGLALVVAGLMIGTPQAKAEDKNIVSTAVEAGGFDTLIAAVQAAGLDVALSGEGPFTVFAPTDEAFAKLPEGTVEALLADTETLTAILTYHVVAGRKAASEVAGAAHLETLNGKALHVTLDGGSVHIGGATVTQTDIEAGNGLIHVIDHVMLPPSE